MVLRQIHIILPDGARAGRGELYDNWLNTHSVGEKWNKKKQVLRKEMLTRTKNELTLNKDPCAQVFQTQHRSIWHRPKKTRGSSALTEPWSLMRASQAAPPPNAGDMSLGFDPWAGKIPLGEFMVTHSSILAWSIPMDRGTWKAMVHRVVKNQTQLSDLARTHAGSLMHNLLQFSLFGEGGVPVLAHFTDSEFNAQRAVSNSEAMWLVRIHRTFPRITTTLLSSVVSVSLSALSGDLDPGSLLQGSARSAFRPSSECCSVSKYWRSDSNKPVGRSCLCTPERERQPMKRDSPRMSTLFGLWHHASQEEQVPWRADGAPPRG